MYRTLCACNERKAACDDGEMFFSQCSRGWVFVNGPLRRMSAKSRYYAMLDRSEFSHTDHTGEPFSFTVCPFCGNDLPFTEPTFLSLPQADGEGTE